MLAVLAASPVVMLKCKLLQFAVTLASPRAHSALASPALTVLLMQVSKVFICCRHLPFQSNICCSCLSPQNCCLQDQRLTPKLSKHSCKLAQYGLSPHWLNSSLRLLSLTWRLSCRSSATCSQMVQPVMLMPPCLHKNFWRWLTYGPQQCDHNTCSLPACQLRS